MKDLFLTLLGFGLFDLGGVATLFAFGFPDHFVNHWWSVPALVVTLVALLMMYLVCLFRFLTGDYR